MTDAWAQLEGESDRAYALFEQFLALGPARSLPRLARARAASLPYLKQLSARWRWQERAADWQARVARAERGDLGDELEEIRSRHVRDARMMRSLARAQMRRWVQSASAQGHRPFTAVELAAMWHMGFQVEHELLPSGQAPTDQEKVEPAGREEEEAPKETRVPEAALDELLQVAVSHGLPATCVPEAWQYLWHLVEQLRAWGYLRGPDTDARHSTSEDGNDG
jgi:hypothetical protein